MIGQAPLPGPERASGPPPASEPASASAPTPARASRKTGRLVRLAWGLVALYVLAGVGGGYYYRGQFAAGWQAPRLDVPVVALECDDFGLDLEPPRYVPLGGQLDLRQETGVKELAQMLAGHHDRSGRPAVITAFIVVHQADTPAIAADPEFRYHFQPIDQSMPRTVAALRDAQARGLFSLAYHGRDHRDVGLWCQLVRQEVHRCRAASQPFDPKAIAAFHTHDPRLMDRIVSEYFDSRNGYLAPFPAAEVEAKVSQGVAEFRRIFGIQPLNTVPPRYLWDEQAEAVLFAHGLRYLHGANKQGGRYRGADDVWARPFGLRLPSGLICVPRNAELEVSLDNQAPPAESILPLARQAFAAGGPLALHTHAANYATPNADIRSGMLARLSEILSSLEKEYPDLHYLSGPELGRLAEDGHVTLSLPGGGTSEVRVAAGASRVWRWARSVYEYRTKARWYVQALAALVALALIVTLVHVVRRVARRRARPRPAPATR